MRDAEVCWIQKSIISVFEYVVSSGAWPVGNKQNINEQTESLVVRFCVCHFSSKLGKFHSRCLEKFLPSKDKRQAEEKKWRVSERTLCATAFCGGWPAGYWAMRRFRHKSATGAKELVVNLTVEDLSMIYPCNQIYPKIHSAKLSSCLRSMNIDGWMDGRMDRWIGWQEV